MCKIPLHSQTHSSWQSTGAAIRSQVQAKVGISLWHCILMCKNPLVRIQLHQQESKMLCVYMLNVENGRKEDIQAFCELYGALYL